MNITIQPGKLNGSIAAIPSKSEAHRLLICAAFADRETFLVCPQTNQDMDATADCLSMLGASCVRNEKGYHITPSKAVPHYACLNVHESGSTLRFLLPIVGALGVETVFQMEGRLSKRPLSPLWEEMERMGCVLSWSGENELKVSGQLRCGDYYIDGGVSSQFITGLLFAASLMEGESRIHILGQLQSRPYVEMTQKAMAQFGVETEGFAVKGGRPYRSPGEIAVEGDWSNGAFFLAAKALGSDVTVSNLNLHSAQGDRAVWELLSELENCISVDASDIPDLVPILAVVAGAKNGATFVNIQRLRLKESDRVASVIAMLKALGGRSEATEDTLTVYPTGYLGGIVDACNDHRIAMAAAIASTACQEPVTVLGAECVRKSYPHFWEECEKLGMAYQIIG